MGGGGNFSIQNEAEFPALPGTSEQRGSEDGQQAAAGQQPPQQQQVQIIPCCSTAFIVAFCRQTTAVYIHQSCLRRLPRRASPKLRGHCTKLHGICCCSSSLSSLVPAPELPGVTPRLGCSRHDWIGGRDARLRTQCRLYCSFSGADLKIILRCVISMRRSALKLVAVLALLNEYGEESSLKIFIPGC